MSESEIKRSQVYDRAQKQFGELAQRVTRQEYFDIVEEIELQLDGRFVEAMSIIPLEDKESFGDIDMVIIWDMPQDQSGEEYYREIFGDKLVDYRHLKNDKMDSVLIRLSNNKIVQADFARTKDEIEFVAKMVHSSKGHSSSVIGTLAMAYGYKFAQDGFYKRYFDKQGQYHDILVTQDLLLGMEMLGLDPNKWIDSTMVDDIVDFISASPFFQSKFYDRKSMKNKRRTAIARRGVQDYMYAKLENSESNVSELSHEEYLKTNFPVYFESVTNQIETIESKTHTVQMNGEIVMEAFSILPSKVVGKILIYISELDPEAKEISGELKRQIIQKMETENGSDNKKSLAELAILELPFPPDIKAGLERSLAEMNEYVANGFTENITTNIKDLLELSARALQSTISWTEKGKSEFEALIRSVLERNLNTGFNNFMKKVTDMVRGGRVESIQLHNRNLENIFMYAKMSEINLSLASEEKPDGDTEMIKTFASAEEARKHIEKIISENILEGIVNKIKSLGEYVASGSDFGRLHPNQTKSDVDRLIWLALNKHGFEEVKERLLNEENIVDASTLRGTKKVNIAELKSFVDDVVRANLAKGAEQTMINYGRNIVFTYQCRDELRQYYQAEADRLGVLDETLEQLIDGKKINPYYWDSAVAEQVRINFEASINAIIEDFLESMRDGRVGRGKSSAETAIESHIELAKKYDLKIDKEVIMKKLKDLITVENVQAGIDRLLERAKESIRSGYVSEAEFAVGRHLLPSMLEYIKVQGMEEEIDTKTIIDYLTENGLTIGDRIPRLGRGDVTKLVREV